MNTAPATRLVSLSLLLGALVFVPAAFATSPVTWDGGTTASTTSGQDSGGTWDQGTTSDWYYTGGSPGLKTYAAAGTAGGSTNMLVTFGAGADAAANTYVINIATGTGNGGAPTNNIYNLTFANTGYILQAASAVMLSANLNAPVTIVAGKSATIGSDVTLKETSGSFGVTGGGTLYIGTNNGTNVTGAVVQASSALTINDSTTVNVGAGGTLIFAGTSSLIGYTTGLTSLSTPDASALTVAGGTVTSSGTYLILGDAAYNSGTLTVNNGGTVNLAGYIRFGTSGTQNTTSVINLGAGAGSTGMLTTTQLQYNNNTNTTATVNFNGGVLQAATGANSIFTATGTGASSNAIITTVGAGGATIDPNGQAITYSSALTHLSSGPATDGGLTVGTHGGATSGNLTLSAANTFNGPTTVLTGNTLTLTNQLALLDSPLNVSGGGNVTFGYAGTNDIGGFISTSGTSGTISAGANTLAIASAGTSAITITGASDYQSAAAIVVTSGGLTLNGTLTVNFSTSLAAGSYTFNLLSNTGGSITNSFSSLSIAGSYLASGTGSATDGNGDTFTLNANDTQLNVNIVSAIPEPATFASLLGAIALGFAISRRRKT